MATYTSQDEPVIQNIGNYAVEEVLSQTAGMLVLRGRDKTTRRPVMIKVLTDGIRELPEPANLDAASTLEHPYILSMLETGVYEDHPYIALPLIPHQTLATLLDKDLLDYKTLHTIIMRISAALDYAHSRGVLHGFLSPESILLDEFNNLYVIDFGMPQAAALNYAAPEFWKQQALDARSDVYSLGVMLYQMVTGELPFLGDDMGRQHLYNTPPIPVRPNQPAGYVIDRPILQAMAKNPDDRFASAGELATSTERALQIHIKTEPQATFGESSDVDFERMVIWSPVVDHRTFQQPSTEDDARIRACIWLARSEAFLSAGLDGRVFLWSLEEDTPQVIANTDSAILSLSFDPDTQRLATGHADGSLRVWELDGTLAYEFWGHTGAVLSCSLVGLTLASGGEDHTLRLWDLMMGEESLVLRKHFDAITAVTLNDDGTLVLSASADKTLRLWNTQSGETLQVFEGHSDIVTACALLGEMVFSGAADGELRIWDILMEEPSIAIVNGHSNAVTACHIELIDGVAVGVSAGWDGMVRVWDLFTIEEHRAFDYQPDAILACDFNGDHILSGSRQGVLTIQARESKPPVQRHDDAVTALTLDDTLLISISRDGSLRQATALTGEAMRTIELNAVPSCVAVTTQYILVGYESGLLKCLDRSSGRIRWEATAHHNAVTFLVHADDQRIITGSKDGILALWNTVNGVRVSAVAVKTFAVRCGVMLDAGVLIGTHEGEVAIWDVMSGKKRAIYGQLGQPLMSMHRVGDAIVGGLAQGDVALWTVGNDTPETIFKAHSAALTTTLIHPTQPILFTASLDGTAALWDISSQLQLDAWRAKSVITAAQWLDQGTLVLGDESGVLQAIEMR